MRRERVVRRARACVAVAFVLVVGGLVPAAIGRDSAGAAVGDFSWVRMLGAASSDEGVAVGRDAAGNLYFAGNTFGPLPGSADAMGGSQDVGIVSLDRTGAVRWIHTFGSAGFDIASGIAVTPAGRVFISGTSDGSLPGAPTANAGG